MSKMSLDKYLSVNPEDLACIKAITPLDALSWYDLYYRNNHLTPKRNFLIIKLALVAILIGTIIAYSCTNYNIIPGNTRTATLEQKINLVISKLDQITRKLNEMCPHNNEEISRIIEESITLYDADKVGLYDHAALYAGGSIESYPETRPYPTNRSMFLFNYFVVDESSKPENILQASTIPGNCFTFYGDKATIILKFATEIQIKLVTMEHSSLGLRTDPRSAPKTFEVYGLRNSYDNNGMFLGKFHYNILGKPWQTFQTELLNTKFQYIKLKILDNHGNKDYTCLYRFRVHSFK